MQGARIVSAGLGGSGDPSVIEVATAGDLPTPAPSGVILAFVQDTDILYAWDTATLSWLVAGGSGALIGRADQVAITNGAQSVSVVFSSPMADTNYAVVFSIGNTVDADPIYLTVVRTNKLTTGFTAVFNAPTDSANYVMDYAVTRDS